MPNLISRIDSLGDRINPITVRDLRKLKRWFGLELLLLLFLGIAVSCATFFLIMPEEMLKQEFDLAGRRERAVLLASGFSLIMFYGSFLAWLTPIIWLIQSRSDELLDQVPLSPTEQTNAVLQTCCVLSFYYITLFFPFLAFAFLLGPVPYLFLLVPLGTFLLALINLLVLVSFVARAKRVWELIVLYFVMSYGLMPMYIPWLGVLLLWVGVLRWPPLFWNAGFGFISLFILLPIALVLMSLTAYWLSVYHFKHKRRSVWLGTLLNIGVYTLFSFILAAVYLGCAAAYFAFFP